MIVAIPVHAGVYYLDKTNLRNFQTHLLVAEMFL